MRIWFCLLLLGLATAVGRAQVRPEEAMILVIGPSARSIDPNEAQIVSRLKELRSQSNLSQLRMATMHFDRPKEAAFARQVLGVQKRDLTCLCLVQLDARTQRPLRALSKIANVTPASLEGVERILMQAAGLSAASGAAPPPPHPTSGPYRPDHPPVRGTQRYTQEGMVNVARDAENKAGQMFEVARNEPLRADHSDDPSRKALATLADATSKVRQAFEQGVVNPRDLLVTALRARDELRRSQPDVNLPVKVRGGVGALFETMTQLEAIYFQLNP